MIELTPPNGCSYCGLPRDRHYGQYTREAGQHFWTEPSDRMRKERMIARRAVRTGMPWNRWSRSRS